SVSRAVSRVSGSRSAEVAPPPSAAVVPVQPSPVSTVSATVLSHPRAEPSAQEALPQEAPPQEVATYPSVRTPVTASARTQPSASRAFARTLAARLTVVGGWALAHPIPALAAGAATLLLVLVVALLGTRRDVPVGGASTRGPARKDTALSVLPPTSKIEVPP